MRSDLLAPALTFLLFLGAGILERDALDPAQAPPSVRTWVEEVSRRMAVPPDLACAVAEAESSWDPSAVSPKGAVGLLQLLPETAAQEAEALGLPSADLYDPYVSSVLGIAYLRRLSDRFEEDPRLVAAAYNAGPTRVATWLRRRPEWTVDQVLNTTAYPETRAYIHRVLRARNRYR